MSLGVVTKYLFDLIAKQVDDQGLVVWYDPEQAYGAVAAELQLPNTTVARYDGSFFKLRKEIDDLLNVTLRWLSGRGTAHLGKLLAEFGPRRQSYHPEYPFWRLQNDGLLELNRTEGLTTGRGNTDAKNGELLGYTVEGKDPLWSGLSARG